MFRVVMGLSRSSSREFEMPELPEVETVRRTIEPQLKGYKVIGISVHEPRLRWRVDGARLRRCIIGQSVLGVTRRAKYLQIFFSGDVCLLVHLGMTGRLSVLRSEVTLEKHDHVIFHLEGGFELRFHDPRRFGSVDVCSISDLPSHPRLAHLGPEPLGPDFGGDYLYTVSRRVRQPVKAFVMDAKRVVGVGNIYACEALFMAGVNPKTRASRLGKVRCERVADAIRTVLTGAIERGGTTIRDFESTVGTPGGYGTNLLVYGRDGGGCPRCEGVIKRIVQVGRSTFYCPGCQRA